jgi:hypothetical protein
MAALRPDPGFNHCIVVYWLCLKVNMLSTPHYNLQIVTWWAAMPWLSCWHKNSRQKRLTKTADK